VTGLEREVAREMNVSTSGGRPPSWAGFMALLIRGDRPQDRSGSYSQSRRIGRSIRPTTTRDRGRDRLREKRYPPLRLAYPPRLVAGTGCEDRGTELGGLSETH